MPLIKAPFLKNFQIVNYSIIKKILTNLKIILIHHLNKYKTYAINHIIDIYFNSSMLPSQEGM